MEEEIIMRVKEKNNFLSFLKTIFIDVDYPDGEEMDIGKSEDPKMTELKDSLNRVNALERSFYVSSSSAPKGGKGNSNIVDKVNVDSNKAIRRVDENERTEQKETSEQQVER